MSRKVSVIIATYNGIDYLKKCIPSILNSDYPDFEIIICDDCSTDNSYAYLQSLQQSESRLVLLRNEANLGAAKTRNNAVQQATGEILAFLDNDTEVDPQWMQQPVQLLQQDPTVGGIQSLLIEYDQRDKIQLAGVKLIPHACWGAPLEHHLEVNARASAPQEIIALSAALFVRKSVHQNIHGFDEKLAIYTEDLEYSLRIWISGFRIVHAPDSFVYHCTKKVSDRTKMHATQSQIYFHLTKNSFRSIIKNYSTALLLRYLPWCILITAIRLFSCLLKGNIASLRSVLAGVRWTLQNMSDTLDQRKHIQSLRQKTDQEIAKKVFTTESIIDIYRHNFT